LREDVRKKLAWIDAMRGVVRTGVDAAGFFEVSAEIARRCFLLDDCFLAAGPLGIVGHHLEGMKIDVAVGTVTRAKTAADTPVFDDDFERITAANRAYWAANHAQRIAALAARCSNQELIEAKAFSDKTSDALMSVGACVDAGIAARAFLQIKDQKALGFHQTLRKELVNRNRVDHLHALFIRRTTLLRNCFEAAAHSRKALDHLQKVFRRDADDLHVIKRGAGGGPSTAA
jgi:hypothetical protein